MGTEDDTVRSSGDESVSGTNGSPREMTEDGILHVYEVGKLIVLGFAGKDVPSNFNVAHYRDAIFELVKANSTETVAFDLTGVRIVPSGMLGLWASITKQDIAVEVYNPSEDIQDVLEITKLNQLISVKEVEL